MGSRIIDRVPKLTALWVRGHYALHSGRRQSGRFLGLKRAVFLQVGQVKMHHFVRMRVARPGGGCEVRVTPAFRRHFDKPGVRSPREAGVRLEVRGRSVEESREKRADFGKGTADDGDITLEAAENV